MDHDDDEDDDRSEPQESWESWELDDADGETGHHPEDHQALSWRMLNGPGSRRRWFLQLWDDVCTLRLRYRLPVRSRWWEDEIQVEALAAMAAWVWRYDEGVYEDPPGKLGLLFELERLETLLRDGNDPFHPHRDRPEFERYLELFGGVDPGVGGATARW